MKFLLYSSIIVFIFLLFSPKFVFASQTSLTMLPGYTYTFQGNDSRVISHISVAGAGRYQFVAWDSYGEVTRFGTAGGRISVSGSGGVAVSVGLPLQVTFDSGRLSVEYTAGTALREIAVYAGHSLRFENGYSTGVNIRTGQEGYFDYAVFNRIGTAVNFYRNARRPQFSLPAGGAAEITAHVNLTVYFPNMWYGVSVSPIDNPALNIVSLYTGQAHNFTNTYDSAFNMRLTPLSDDALFFYEYSLRGRDGHVISHGNAEGVSRQIGTNQTLFISPLMDGELFFPYAWLEYIDTGQGAGRPFEESFSAGQTITISNTENMRPHRVYIGGVDFVFDYVLEYDDNVTFNIVEAVGLRESINIPAGAVLTITAVTDIVVSYPDIDTVQTERAEPAALVRYTIEAGESVRLSNSGEETLRLRLVADENADLDYVRRDIDGEIVSFGRAETGSVFNLLYGQTALITNPAEIDIVLNFPRVYDIEIEPTAARALYRRILSRGEAVSIENHDRRYNHNILIQNESNRTFANANVRRFEYAAFPFRDVVGSFGEASLGFKELPSTGRINIMPLDRLTNADISIVFPTDIAPSLRITAITESPIHRIVLRPGERKFINNRNRTDFTIQTDGNFYMRQLPPGELKPQYMFTIYETDERVYEYVYVREPIYSGSNDFPIEGDITLYALYETTIFAARGADLELWLPQAWARRLRL